MWRGFVRDEFRSANVRNQRRNQYKHYQSRASSAKRRISALQATKNVNHFNGFVSLQFTIGKRQIRLSAKLLRAFFYAEICMLMRDSRPHKNTQRQYTDASGCNSRGLRKIFRLNTILIAPVRRYAVEGKKTKRNTRAHTNLLSRVNTHGNVLNRSLFSINSPYGNYGRT